MIKNFRKLEENDLDQVSGGVLIANVNKAGGAVLNNDLVANSGARPREDHLVYGEANKPEAIKLGGANRGGVNNSSAVVVVSGGLDGELV